MTVVGLTGKIIFDASKSDGTPRKLIDVSRLSELGWQSRIPLEEGIADAYQDFQRRFPIDSEKRKSALPGDFAG